MPRAKTILVRARLEGVPVPMIRDRVKPNKRTGRDDTMIYHDDPREVPNLSFYRRAMRRGDLEIAPISAAKKAPKKEGKS